MKVIESTPDLLVIEDRPWFLWIILGVLGASSVLAGFSGQTAGPTETTVVFVVGLGAFGVLWHFAPFQRFTFDRTSGVFTHRVIRVTGRRTWERPLSDIRRAADEGNRRDGARLERITLLTHDTDRHPLESGFSSQSRKPVIDAINEWLAGGAEG